MKMFWEILGTKKKLYTGRAVKYIIDEKDGKKYYTGEGRLYKKKEYPKNLAENIIPRRYDFYYGVAALRKPDRIEKKGFLGKIRHVYASVDPQQLEREYLDCFGLWKIEGLNVYTGCAADYFRDKLTGKEYRRSEDKVLFKNEDESPFPLAEHTDRYEYILELDSSAHLTTNDYLREINTALTINNLFKK